MDLEDPSPGRVLSAIEGAGRIVRAWRDCRRAVADLRGATEYKRLRTARRRLAAELRLKPAPARSAMRTMTGAQAVVALARNRVDPYADRYDDEEWYRDPGEWWKTGDLDG